MGELYKRDYKGYEKFKSQFRKGVLNVGDVVSVLEPRCSDNRYIKYTVIEKVDKGLFCSYLLKNSRTGIRTSLTDKDFCKRDVERWQK